MRFLLVLQSPGSTEDDYQALIDVEDELEGLLTASNIDGHDFGSGEMNIFVETDDPSHAFIEAQQVLSRHDRWSGVRAAFRSATGEDYTILWPPDLDSFEVT